MFDNKKYIRHTVDSFTVTMLHLHWVFYSLIECFLFSVVKHSTLVNRNGKKHFFLLNHVYYDFIKIFDNEIRRLPFHILYRMSHLKILKK